MKFAITKMSSKGQVVIPIEMRADVHTGEQFIVIKENNRFLLKKLSEVDQNFSVDLVFAKKTEEALKRYKKRLFKEMNKKAFLKALKKW